MRKLRAFFWQNWIFLTFFDLSGACVTIFCSIASTADTDFAPCGSPFLLTVFYLVALLLTDHFDLYRSLQITHHTTFVPSSTRPNHKTPSLQTTLLPPIHQHNHNVRFRQSHRPGHRHGCCASHRRLLLAQGASSLPLLPQGLDDTSPQPASCQRTRWQGSCLRTPAATRSPYTSQLR